MFSDGEEILPSFQYNSFIVPVEEPYEFVDSEERQAYGRFHYECRFNKDKTYTMEKHASRIIENER